MKQPLSLLQAESHTLPWQAFCWDHDLPIRVRRTRLTIGDLIRICHCHCHCHCHLDQQKESLHMVAEHKIPTIDASHESSAAAWSHTADAVADATADAAAARCTPNCRKRETVKAIGPERVRSHRDAFREEQWPQWSWKIKTVILLTNGELAEVLNAAEERTNSWT